MIRTFQPADFEWLQKWVSDPKALFTFAGPSWTFPITLNQIIEHQIKFPDKQLFVGVDENNAPFAIGEIILNEEHAPRLGRLLIGDPAKRGLGLGEKFIRELIHQCIHLQQHTKEICLFVLEENTSAIHIYKKIGFVFSDEKIPDMTFNNQSYPVKKMILQTS
jgi:RimJ/RimL family protein N-acetyltransferase